MLLYIFLNGDVFRPTSDKRNLRRHSTIKQLFESMNYGSAMKYEDESEDCLISHLRSAEEESIQVNLSEVEESLVRDEQYTYVEDNNLEESFLSITLDSSERCIDDCNKLDITTDIEIIQLDGPLDLTYSRSSRNYEPVKPVFGINCEKAEIIHLMNFFRSFNITWLSSDYHKLCCVDEECFFCYIRSSFLRLRQEQEGGVP